ncbi:MAG: protein kinase [Deltaproteobacteria bacterium]|nr:protein kinase [Deltaproteobacteria bacterium]
MDAADTLPSIDGYDVLRELGRGAMGVVYLGRDRFLEREVAIKFVADALSVDAVQRFLREARAMARLSHPNVATIYRAGVSDSAPFLVMELLRGRSLDEVLACDGPLSAERLLLVALHAARGIAAAHSRGIVHRDIKPSNLFETDEGTIKVLDFGIAKVDSPANLQDIELATQQTSLGPERLTAERVQPSRASASSIPAAVPAELVPFDATVDVRSLHDTRSLGSNPSADGTQITGTALYMAPEVWRSEGADHASDVWSLGATLYHLATGRAPFEGRSITEIAFNILVANPVADLAPKRGDLQTEFVELIERCLAKNRARRYASAQEVLEALERLSRASRPQLPGQWDAPYPGLRAMDTQDRDRFFGRDDDAGRVLERLRAEWLVVLVGASGTGKSSLAGAGVAPQIAQGILGDYRIWRVIRVVPGPSPLASLAGALASTLTLDAVTLERDLRDHSDTLARTLREAVARDEQGVLLLMDQLEELVTAAEPLEAECVAASLARVVDAAPRGVRVLATARSDLFDRLGSLGALGARLGRATELVRPLEGALLREALVAPAKQAGYTFEDIEIINEIVRSVGEGTATLPLVAFALRAWWEHRDRDRKLLTRHAWQTLGGVLGALGAHADAVYDALASGERSIAHLLFTRLCANDGTRRYATHSELVAVALGQETSVTLVLDAFERARLIHCEGDRESGSYTITHEALAHAWLKLRGWIDAGREDRALHEQLSEAVHAWKSAERRPELLWRGALLIEVARWREVYDDTLSQDERAFVLASERRERRQRRARILGVSLLVAGLGGSAVALGVGRSAALQGQFLARNTLAAVETLARREAYARALSAAHALREDDPSAALAWLVSASRALGRVTPVVRALALGMVGQGVAMRVRCTSNVDLREDGSTAVCAVGEQIHVMDLVHGTVRTVEALGAVHFVVASEGGSTLYWIDRGRSLMRWDEIRGREVLARDLTLRSVLATSSSGDRVVVLDVGADTLSIWDRGQPASREGLRVLRRGLFFAKTSGEWGLEMVARDVVLVTLRHQVLVGTRGEGQTADVRTQWRALRIAVDRGLENSGVSADCERLELTPDALLCAASASVVRAISLASGDERALTERERRIMTDATATSNQRDAPRVLARIEDRTLQRNPRTHRVDLVGSFALDGPLGVTGVAIEGASVEPQGRRIALRDQLGNLLVYANPSLTIRSGTWVPRDLSSIQRLRAQQLGRPAVSVLASGAVAVAAQGLGVFVVAPTLAGPQWSHYATRTVAVFADNSRALLGLSDGTGVLADLSLERVAQGELLAHGVPVAVALDAHGERIAAAPERGDTVLRDVHESGWTVRNYRTFSELTSGRALALQDPLLAVSGRHLGVTELGGLTMIASAPSTFDARSVERLLFVGHRALVAGDRGGQLWYAQCIEQMCAVSPLGEGHDPHALDGGVTLALGEAGSLWAMHPGWSSPADVIAPRRLPRLAAIATESLALGVGEDSLAIVSGAREGVVTTITLPPANLQDFSHWVAQRTNVLVAPDGMLTTGAVPLRLL